MLAGKVQAEEGLMSGILLIPIPFKKQTFLKMHKMFFRHRTKCQ